MTTCANPWNTSPPARSTVDSRPRRGLPAPGPAPNRATGSASCKLLVWALLGAGAPVLAQTQSGAEAQDGAAAEESAAQANTASGLGDIEIVQSTTCFGFTDIANPRALEICDALALERNVRARELAEHWVDAQPDSPAAQFAFAEVLYTAEGNLARALFHLNRAESLMGYADIDAAVESGNIQWHYLSLSQLSNVHQLMGDQTRALEYLDKIEEIYGQNVESFRGWPLLKLKQYDAARASATVVLDNSENQGERARAWNTLCAVELASLAPVDSMAVCDRAISEDENLAAQSGAGDTVYLTNASEVALSLLRMDDAENYLDRATRNLNPDSVADPWVYKLYLTMSQGRFDDARAALDRMLVWRENQKPIVGVMNRAEHYMVGASFMLLAGYAEDAALLSATALNQPDRNGAYSADDFQKDALAALVNAAANRMRYQMRLEEAAGAGWVEALRARIDAAGLWFAAWRSERYAASLFTRPEILLNRLRPYAPLDVHIPEWIEPELARMIGAGVLRGALDEALAAGAFELNIGYYHAWLAEAAAVESDAAAVVGHGARALAELPAREALLRARVAARMGAAHWRLGAVESALEQFENAFRADPGVSRRLGIELPVNARVAGGEFSRELADALRASPRFREDDNGFPLEAGDDGTVCLRAASGEALSCYTAPAESAVAASRAFHARTFGPGFTASLEIGKAQRSILRGSSVILANSARSAERTPELLSEN